jgi:hypothetical protein
MWLGVRGWFGFVAGTTGGVKFVAAFQAGAIELLDAQQNFAFAAWNVPFSVWFDLGARYFLAVDGKSFVLLACHYNLTFFFFFCCCLSSCSFPDYDNDGAAELWVGSSWHVSFGFDKSEAKVQGRPVNCSVVLRI